MGLTDGGSYPTVTGLKVRVGGRDLFVGAQVVAGLGPDGVRLREHRLNLASFERRPGEVLLAEDVLDRALIDVGAARLVHANDLLLSPPSVAAAIRCRLATTFGHLRGMGE